MTRTTDDSALTAMQPGKPYALLILLQLHWFVRLRWIFAGATLAVLAIERFALPRYPRPWALLWFVLCVGGVNVVWTWVAHVLRRQLAQPGMDEDAAIRSGQMFVGAQIASDLLLLTCILTLTGGVENPMALFYLFHAAISGLLLRTAHAVLHCCWGVLLYIVMAVGQASGWIPYFPFLPQLGSAGLYDAPAYVVPVVVVLALSVLGTLYFTDRIGSVLDSRQTMLIRINAELDRSRQEIQALQQRRSRFMQVAAHQLKSPLALVQTLAGLIRDDIVTEPAAIHATCEKIIRRCRDGVNQVSELLALARVQEADPRRHGTASADVGRVVTDLCLKHTIGAEERTIAFSWRVPSTAVVMARVEPADLSDCVGNLIENAIKYTPNGGSVQVLVTCGKRRVSSDGGPPVARDEVFITVRDTGIGFDESCTIRWDGRRTDTPLFEPFRRGNRALAAGIPGTGLGLSIVREVVSQAGGFIHVYSRRGLGTRITVSFPAIFQEAGRPADGDSAAELGAEVDPQRSGTS